MAALVLALRARRLSLTQMVLQSKTMRITVSTSLPVVMIRIWTKILITLVIPSKITAIGISSWYAIMTAKIRLQSFLARCSAANRLVSRALETGSNYHRPKWRRRGQGVLFSIQANPSPDAVNKAQAAATTIIRWQLLIHPRRRHHDRRCCDSGKVEALNVYPAIKVKANKVLKKRQQHAKPLGSWLSV